MSEIACVLEAKALLGEAALWDAAEQALFWVDIMRREVHRFDPRGGGDRTWTLPQEVGCLALREKGGLVVAMGSGFHFFDPASGSISAVALPEAERPGNRMNDGRTDRQGRFWAGSMDRKASAATGALYRLDGTLACTCLVEDIIVSNSLAWSPDGRTMYYADSGRRTVWAWDFEPDEGAIASRRQFCRLADSDGVPDGATVDAEGFLWVAVWRGSRIARYDPLGRLVREIKLPITYPTCPAFGGPALDVLYVTSASNRLSPEALAAEPLAGGLFALDVGVRGLPDARFKG